MIIATVVQTASQSVSMFIGARSVLFNISTILVHVETHFGTDSSLDSDRPLLVGYSVIDISGRSRYFAATAAPLLITEIAYPPYRAPLTSFYNSLYYGGTIAAAWTTYGTFKISTTWVYSCSIQLEDPFSTRWMFILISL